MAELGLRGATFRWRRPLLMGIVNANPDSFSDPGVRTVDAVVARALALVDAGAGALDIGAQSAITGRSQADPEIEAAAVAPVVRAVVKECPDVLVSVDAFKPAVVEAALDAGAHLVNDVSGLRDRGIARLCAEAGAGLVVMHTAAAPLTRLQDPGMYADVAAEVAGFLAARIAAAAEAGVPVESIVVDPGVDFTKTPAQSVELLRGIGAVLQLGRPVLLALSRKDFLGALTGRAPAGRDAGTLGAIAAMRHVPDQILRVHDVAATVDLLAVLDALTGDVAVPADLVLPDELRHQRPGHVAPMADIEANKAKVREFYDRSHAGDLAVYDEMLSPSFVNYGGPAGELHGPEAFKQAYVGFATAMSDFRTSIDMIVAEGDLVAVYGVATGTHDGDFMGLPPTGNTLRWTGMAIYRFDAGGLIEGRWQEIDGLGLFGQLGLLPPLPDARQ